MVMSASADRWDRIAGEVFERASYQEFVSNDLTSCTFLGQTVSGVHPDTVQKLIAAEQSLRALQGESYVAPGISSTQRERQGMHGWGMAIDFDVLRNPYLLNEAGEKDLDKETIAAYDHVADFMLGKSQSVVNRLSGGRAAFGGGTIPEVYDALREESDAMQQYFAMRDDDAALSQFLAGKWAGLHSSAAPTVATIKAQMVEDYELLGGKTAGGGKRPAANGDRPFSPKSGGGNGDPATGFLNLPREFVLAMTGAGFAWGAIDMGAASGDMQHFDLRLSGNGARAYNLLLRYK
jgi:hypothetical protein